MSLAAIREAVRSTIATGIPMLKTCDTHGGRFDAEELARMATRTPAVLVATLGFSDLTEGQGEYRAEVRFVAFAVASDKPGLPRDKAVMAMADALSKLIPGNRWGLEESESAPQDVRADNLYSGQLNKSGVTLWAVTWRQRMMLGQAMDDDTLATLNIFETCDLQYAMGSDGTPVAEDMVQLPQED
ncbi:MAG: DUF1834 family protein [Proteobacteria bacterium]|nr:DUF1834 family protein [Pseudomonadota bacterium]